jgi:hypothetical protein
MKITCLDTPAKAEVHGWIRMQWIPAFAGMT